MPDNNYQLAQSTILHIVFIPHPHPDPYHPRHHHFVANSGYHDSLGVLSTTLTSTPSLDRPLATVPTLYTSVLEVYSNQGH